MTPQLQQAIRLLQLSSLELQTEIQEALETNPLLEVEEEYDYDEPSSVRRDEDTGSRKSANWKILIFPKICQSIANGKIPTIIPRA